MTTLRFCKALLRALVSPLSRLLPARCVVCDLHSGDAGTRLCGRCASDFFAADRVRCERCAIGLPACAQSADVCGRCLSASPHFDATTALADYVSPVDGMILALKFAARLDLANFFGRLLGHTIAHVRQVDRDALVIPVPLSFERTRQRGFNQSHHIARAFVAARGGRLAVDRLLRVRDTPPQQSLSLADRRGNVRGAFAVAADVAGRFIFVVDDVMTSGSTLDEVAAVLKRAGASRVHNLIVARTP